MTVRNAATMGTYGATWEAAGYCGSGNVSSLIGTLRGRSAVVCGAAETVFQDMRILEKLHDPVIFAVNDVGMFLPKVDHFVSLHSDNIPAWKTVRWLHAKDREYTKYHAPDSRPYVDFVWDRLTPVFALSGYFAMQIAYIMGAELIILCGCTGDETRRFFDFNPRDNFFYGADINGSGKGIREQLEKEMGRLPAFKMRVKSMSGWTREFFGGL